MTQECFHLDELDSLLDLQAGDTRWEHVNSCPLCRARLAAYRTFISERPPLPGSQPERAKAELDAFVKGLVMERALVEGQPGWWARLRDALRQKRLLAVGAAGLAVFLVVILYPFMQDRGPEAPLLRGPQTQAPGVQAVSLQPPVIEDGSVSLVWTPLAEADLYEVHIFDKALAPVARFKAGLGTSLRIPTGEIPTKDAPLLCRVVAFREGDEIGHSPLLPLDLR